MFAKIRNSACDEPIVAAALAVALGGMATILGAWFFEYVLKYQPCALCLEQRIPYYVVIPLAVLVAFGASNRWPRNVLLLGLVIIALLMLWGAGLGVYHSGIEWKLWAGPAECSGTPGIGGAGDLLNRIQNEHIVRCDDAAWRLFGISLAGYNAMVASALAAIALVAAWAGRTAYGSSSVSQ